MDVLKKTACWLCCNFVWYFELEEEGFSRSLSFGPVSIRRGGQLPQRVEAFR
tara:strand:- start:7906 stop:8061 length:156 start_codon:yes stop_codon:yes gene_type:complete